MKPAKFNHGFHGFHGWKFSILLILSALSASAQPWLGAPPTNPSASAGSNYPPTGCAWIAATPHPFLYGTGLQYWFPLDSATTLYDAAGNSPNGTFTGSPTAVSAVISNGLTFNGTSAYATTGVTNSTNWASGAGTNFTMTVNCWIKPTTASNDAGTHTIWWQGKNDVGSASYWAFYFQNGSIFAGYYGGGGGTGCYVQTNNVSPWLTSTWTMWTLEMQAGAGGNCWVYTNGALYATNVAGSPGGPAYIDLASTHFTIGAQQANNAPTLTDFFGGSIDDLGIYSTLVSTSDLLNIYAAGTNALKNSGTLTVAPCGEWQ